jgi:hypothetical protein
LITSSPVHQFTSSPVHQFTSSPKFSQPTRFCERRAVVRRWRERSKSLTRHIASGLFAFFGLSQIGSADLMKGASLLCGDEKQVPVYVFTPNSGDGLVRLNAVSDEKRMYRFSLEKVSQEEVSELCELGHSVASTPLPQPLPQAGVEAQKAIGANSSIPSSFTIVGTYYGSVFGNFWVPALIPRGQSTQWSAFDVLQTNFEAPYNDSHLVHSLLTYSSDNIASSFSGKGIILGQFGSGFACGTVGGTYTSAAEIWGDGYGGNVLSPSTCAQNMVTGVSYGFTTAANMAQQMTYSKYISGASSPIFSTPVFSAVGPGFVTGYSGVTFFVSTNGRVPANGGWSLQFSGVSSGTF